MKKKHVITLVAFALVLAALVLVLVTKREPEQTAEKIKYESYPMQGAFNTTTTVYGYATSGEEFMKVVNDAWAQIYEYHQLFDIYYEYEGINNLCTINILLIPFCLRRFGIKNVMLMAMGAWVLRFGLFGFGNPGSGVWMFLLSMVVYGIAFDFFNVSGSLFVDKETDSNLRSSAQGLFIMMTNGIGATIGTLGAQQVINHFVGNSTGLARMEGWSQSWLVFAAYALVVAVLFAIVFKYKHTPESK